MTEGLRIEKNDRVATLTLDRPERKNPLTFELYAALRDWFRTLTDDRSIRAVVLTGAGGNFCSGGDVHEIIGPLTRRRPAELLEFTLQHVVHRGSHCPRRLHPLSWTRNCGRLLRLSPIFEGIGSQLEG